MTFAILISAALSLPPSAQAVRIAADTWPSIVDAAKVEAPPAGEKIWFWSPDCAPMRVTSEAAQIECRSVASTVVRVVDERGKKVAGAKIVWGTSEMLIDIPETMLPSAITGEDGIARIARPAEGAQLRVAGPMVASWWQKVGKSQTAISIRASAATPVTARLLLPGGMAATRSIVEVELASVVYSADDVRSWAASERETIAFLPLPRMAVRYTAWSSDASPQTGIGTTEGFPRVVALLRGGQVEGRVSDSKNLLNEAAIEAVFRIPGTSRGLRRRARSEANGRFAVRGLTLGPVQLVVRKPGYAPSLRALKVDGRMSIDDIILRAARSVTAHIVDRTGRPVAGAEIRTRDGGHATADANGVATLDAVPAGENVILEAKAHSFRPASVALAPAARGDVEIVLSHGVRVLASIFKAGTRDPAGPGNVMIVNNGAKRIEAFESSGQIEIGGLDAGTLSIEIRAAGSMPFAVAGRTVREDEEVNLGELALPTGASMTGRLVSRSSAAPIANGRIRTLRRGSAGPILSVVMHDWIETTSGEDGTFQVAGAEPGPQVLLVEANGFASRVVTTDVASDQAPLDLGAVGLDQARELIVNCVPVRRCGTEARILLSGAEFPWASASGLMQEGTAHVLPAPSGTATLRLLSNGRIIEERAVDISPQSETTTVDLKLRSTAVTGSVAANGRPRGGGQVHLERAGGGSHVLPIYMESHTAEGQVASGGAVTDMPEMQMAHVDDDGRFSFSDVRPGSYTATYRRDGTTAPPLQLTVPELEHFEFTIDLPPGEIRGRVVDGDAAPVARALVEVRDASGQQQVTVSDAAGEFSMSGIASGHVTVMATRKDQTGAAEAEIAPPRVPTVEIVLRTKEATRNEVAVITPEGQPLPGATVFLLGSGAFPAGVATTDTSGTATFHPSQAVTAPAAAYSASYGWAWMTARSIASEAASQQPIRMSGATGTLVVSSQKSASIELFTPGGVPVAAALAMLGVPLSAGPGNELRVLGLPPGTYTLQAGTFRGSAEVHAGKDARVSIR